MRVGDGTRRASLSSGDVRRGAACATCPTLGVDGQTRSHGRPRRRGRRHPDADQGRLAPPGPDQPPRPDRRRPGGVARRDAADGRDQRCVRGADPARRRRGARRRQRDRPTGRRSSRASRARRGGPPRPEADPPGHRPGRHQRHLPAAQPGRRQRRAGGRRCPASRRCATTPSGREPPRASTPTGPLVRDRLRHFRRPPAPSLEDAEATVITSASSTATRSARSRRSSRRTSTGSPGRSATTRTWSSAARVIQADLDRRGVAAASHPADRSAGSGRGRPEPDRGPEMRDRPPIPEGDP